MLNIVYFSNVTNYTHRFIQKLDWKGETIRIPVKGDFEETLTHPYVLVIPSYGTMKTGHIPPQVRKFFRNKNNRELCVGVIGTGNMNFGDEFAYAGDEIAGKLGVPTLYRLELAGTQEDVEKVQQGLKDYEKHLINHPLPFQELKKIDKQN